MKIRLFGLYRTVEFRALDTLGYIESARGKHGGIRPYMQTAEIQLGALLSGLERGRIPPTHEREPPKAKPSFELNWLEQMLLESRLATIAYQDVDSMKNLCER